MECGNVLINFCFHNVDPDTGKYTFRKLIEGHNIFLTLAMLFAFIWCLENIKQRKQVFVSVILVFFTALPCLVLEGGFYLLPIAVVLWFFHGRKPLQCAGIAAWCLLLLIKALVSHYTGSTGTSLYTDLCFDNEWANFLVILFMLLYNGARGKNTKFTKYLFYVIYPVHLWILMILRYLIIS